jgi:hypothetical protein
MVLRRVFAAGRFWFVALFPGRRSPGIDRGPLPRVIAVLPFQGWGWMLDAGPDPDPDSYRDYRGSLLTVHSLLFTFHFSLFTVH